MLPDMSKIQMRLFWWFLNTFVTLAIRNSSHSLLWSSELLLVLFSRESSILSHWSSWGHLTKGVELRNRKTLLKCNTWKHWATDDERMGVAGLLRQKKNWVMMNFSTKCFSALESSLLTFLNVVKMSNILLSKCLRICVRLKFVAFSLRTNF